MVIRCVRRPCVTCGPVFFRFVTFRIIMDIWDFFVLKYHWEIIEIFRGLSVGTLSNEIKVMIWPNRTSNEPARLVIIYISRLYGCIVKQKWMNGIYSPVQDDRTIPDQVVVWITANFSPIKPLGITFCDISFQIQTYSLKTMPFKCRRHTIGHFVFVCLNAVPNTMRTCRSFCGVYKRYPLGGTARWLQLQPSSAWPQRRKRSKMFSLCTIRITAQSSWNSSRF